MCDCSDLITKVADEIYIKIEKIEEDIAWVKDNQHKIDEHGRNRIESIKGLFLRIFFFDHGELVL